MIESGLPWPDEQTDKVDLGIFILGNHDFVINSGGWRPVQHKKHIQLEQLNSSVFLGTSVNVHYYTIYINISINIYYPFLLWEFIILNVGLPIMNF